MLRIQGSVMFLHVGFLLSIFFLFLQKWLVNEIRIIRYIFSIYCCCVSGTSFERLSGIFCTLWVSKRRNTNVINLLKKIEKIPLLKFILSMMIFSVHTRRHLLKHR